MTLRAIARHIVGFFVIVIGIVAVFWSHPVSAYVSGGVGRIGLSPGSATWQTGQNVSVDVFFNTANVPISGVSARLRFSGTDLSVVSVATAPLSGWSFPVSTAQTASGVTTIDLMAINISTTGYSTSADTKFATITFRPLSSFSGKAVTFDQNQTKMLRKSDAADIAGTLVNGSYTASGDTVQPTPTPTPTPAPTPTPTPGGGGTGGPDNPIPTPTPTPIYSGGNVVPYCASLSANPTYATGVPTTIQFTCSGVDPDGDITAAEFFFGDGASQLVEKNVGSPGSLFTTHAYTLVGTKGASCRVRDNNRVYSSISETCKAIVTIKPSPAGPTQQQRFIETKTILPSPIADISRDVLQEAPTPTPTIEPTITPTPTPREEERESRFPWWIVGIVLALGAVGGFLYLKKRSSENVPPPSVPQPPQPDIPSAPPPSG